VSKAIERFVKYLEEESAEVGDIQNYDALYTLLTELRDISIGSLQNMLEDRQKELVLIQALQPQNKPKPTTHIHTHTNTYIRTYTPLTMVS